MQFYGWGVNRTVFLHPHIPYNFEDLFDPFISSIFTSCIFSGTIPD